jgi:hypothetical protein
MVAVGSAIASVAVGSGIASVGSPISSVVSIKGSVGDVLGACVADWQAANIMVKAKAKVISKDIFFVDILLSPREIFVNSSVHELLMTYFL